MNIASWLPHVAHVLPRTGLIGCDTPTTQTLVQKLVPDAEVVLFNTISKPIAVAVIHGETDLDHLGNQAPVLIAKSLDVLVPSGKLLVWASSRFWQAAHNDSFSGITKTDFVHMLQERGVSIDLMVSPGVFAKATNQPFKPQTDLEYDQVDGVLESGKIMVAVARKWETSDERSRHFFASLPLRTTAATCICIHPDTNKILTVFDTFKQGWTLPGGVVDLNESPQEGAIRETYEEAGVKVSVTGLGGVFTDARPHRLHFMYFATPTPNTDGSLPDNIENPTSCHPHEISDVAWIDLDQTSTTLNRFMATRLSQVLSNPGITWPSP